MLAALRGASSQIRASMPNWPPTTSTDCTWSMLSMIPSVSAEAEGESLRSSGVPIITAVVVASCTRAMGTSAGRVRKPWLASTFRQDRRGKSSAGGGGPLTTQASSASVVSVATASISRFSAKPRLLARSGQRNIAERSARTAI